ncbi:MAG: nucleolar RNA-binding Nop10p family protein [Candidatus Woesearchaeota archaeon]
MRKLRICPSCGKYTMKDICDSCNVNTVIFKTLKFSLEDKYQQYRISKKREYLKN